MGGLAAGDTGPEMNMVRSPYGSQREMLFKSFCALPMVQQPGTPQNKMPTGMGGPHPSSSTCSGVFSVPPTGTPISHCCGGGVSETCDLKYANAYFSPLHGARRPEHDVMAQAGHKMPGPGTAVLGRDDLLVRKIH